MSKSNINGRQIDPDSIPKLVTRGFRPNDASKACSLMASGKCGKVAVVF